MYDDQYLLTNAPGPQAASQADLAARYLRMLRPLADEVEAAAPGLPPAAGRLEWRSEASSAYDTRLESLRGSLRRAAYSVESARAQLTVLSQTLAAEASSGPAVGA